MKETRYDFSRNWRAFSETIEARRLDKAKTDLVRLDGDLLEKSFLDNGNLSGLHSARAALLGAWRNVAVDYNVTLNLGVLGTGCGEWIVRKTGA